MKYAISPLLRALGFAGVIAAAQPVTAQTVTSLGRYNVDTAQTTVSGLSSGAFMAHQLHVAHSDVIQGAAILAGGPYFCAGFQNLAQGSATKAVNKCMKASILGGPSADESFAVAQDHEAKGLIAPLGNLKDDRVFIFAGTNDTVVDPKNSQALYAFYRDKVKLDAPGSSIAYIADETQTRGAGHTFPVSAREPISGKLTVCKLSSDPFIGACQIDAAGELLKQVLGGPLKPKADTLTGKLIAFNQGEFIPNPRNYSMDDTGYVYVPESCAKGESCRLHVALHGCLQSVEALKGTLYIEETGYLPYADTNNLIVLFPQTVSRNDVISVLNPQGCWNWFGYGADANYPNRAGAQIGALRAMIDRIGSGR